MRKLAVAFPASFGDEQKAAGVAALWRELLDNAPWITKAVFVAGIYQLIWTHRGDFVPVPSAALDYFTIARQKAEREAAKALPPPPPREESAWAKRSGPDRAAFLERHLAIGRLRERAGVSLVGFDGALIPFEPSEQEIAGMIGQLRAERFCFATLERIASGEMVSPAELISAGSPRAKSGGPITAVEATEAYRRRGLVWPGSETGE